MFLYACYLFQIRISCEPDSHILTETLTFLTETYSVLTKLQDTLTEKLGKVMNIIY